MREFEGVGGEATDAEEEKGALALAEGGRRGGLTLGTELVGRRLLGHI